MSELSIIFPDRPGDVRSIIGVSEDLSQTITPTVHRGYTGFPIVLGSSFGTKWSVSLSASGDRVQTPAIDDIRIGDRLVVNCASWWRSLVRLPFQWDGEYDSIDIPRLRPAARSYFRSEDGRFSVDARGTAHPVYFLEMLSLGDRAGLNLDRGVFWYRPQLTCLVTSMSSDGTSSDRSQGWSLELEEEFAA